MVLINDLTQDYKLDSNQTIEESTNYDVVVVEIAENVFDQMEDIVFAILTKVEKENSESLENVLYFIGTKVNVVTKALAELRIEAMESLVAAIDIEN